MDSPFRIDSNFTIRLTASPLGFTAYYMDAVGEMVVDSCEVTATAQILLAHADRLPEGWDA